MTVPILAFPDFDMPFLLPILDAKQQKARPSLEKKSKKNSLEFSKQLKMRPRMHSAAIFSSLESTCAQKLSNLQFR